MREASWHEYSTLACQPPRVLPGKKQTEVDSPSLSLVESFIGCC